MKIRALLFTFCILLITNNKLFAETAGIPVSEYNSLKEFYLNTVGEEWTNNTNWLDTTNHSVANWYGIIVENGHVTKIELPNNNLYEEFSGNSLQLPELRTFDISENQLEQTDFAELNHLSKLEILKIKNNKFTFIDIEPIFSHPNFGNFSFNFTYSPQAKIDESEQITINQNDVIEISIKGNYLSPNDQLQWYKDGVKIDGETSATFHKLDSKPEDSGIYHLEISNPNVPGLTLKSNTKVVTVQKMSSGIPELEYNALVDFYNNLDGNNWTNNENWLDTVNHEVSDWHGITVEDGHVTEIYFSPITKIGIKGNIPNSIKQLSFLKKIYVHGEKLSGQIPEGLYELTNLEEISFRMNLISGSISENINKLSSLKYLDISVNQLTGEIPSNIGDLVNLENIYLYSNKLSGSIPPEIGDITNLKELYLFENSLTGKIPTEIGYLSNLKYFLSGHNQLTSIPKEIGNLTNLETLSLHDNNIEGPIPMEFGNLNKLVYLNLERNWIGKITNENTSRVARQIPDELENIGSLRILFLASNYIQFNDIESIFSWTNFSELTQFSYKYQYITPETKYIEAEPTETITISMENYFPANSDNYQWVKNNDPIPGANNATLEIRNIQSDDEGEYYCLITNSVASNSTVTNYSTKVTVNYIHGAGIPLSEYNALVAFYNSTNGHNWFNNANWLDTMKHSVAEWAGIEVIDGHVRSMFMDSNNVVGVLPIELLNLKFLESMGLVKNKISGILPSNFNELSHLRIISLSKNDLTGEIPTSIGQIDGLYYLGLYNNNLEGTIPSEIGNNINLEVLYLGYNKLHGTIPENLGNLTKIRHLNIEHNSLEGPIPASIGNLTELRTLDLSDNQIVGPIPVELENLTKVYRIDIDNNLIGYSSNNTKSAKLTNNRQIPDGLSDLLTMDTLRLARNNLQFNDIEPIFSWDNFNNLNDFTYYPQNKIGLTKSVSGKTEESISLSIDNYYRGASDKYQWYKNGISILNAKSETLELTNLKLSDAGEYKCVVTNSVASELTLTSNTTTLIITPKPAGAGVPKNEYLTLVEIYNSTNGDAWINSENWLDTSNYTVDDWFGITVENGHVVAIDFSNLGLTGNVSQLFPQFDSLRWLNLSGNNLSGEIPSFKNTNYSIQKSSASNETNLLYLNISKNNFSFFDLEPNFSELNSIDVFIYSPQNQVVSVLDTSIYKYDTFTYEIGNYIPGEYDIYTWIKDGSTIENENNISFKIENAALQDSGWYVCSITNSLFPGLAFSSDTCILKVLIPVGIEENNLKAFNVFPNPAINQIYVDTRNELVDLSVFTLNGKLIFEKNDFYSGWIDIKELKKGIYIFRLVTQKSELINKKVVFK